MTAKTTHSRFIGTAGWSIASQYADRFAGSGTHLQRYARVMPAAEINTSFYRPHQRATYERWAASTPPDFRFAVKVPKAATHDARLRETEAILDRFADEVSGLGTKLGVLLVQLPPSLRFDEEVADRFFSGLTQRLDAAVACEPRHTSWFTHAEDFLAGRRIARVAADPAPAPEAAKPGGWKGLTYYRLHGSPRMYHSPYPDAVLDELAVTLSSLSAPVWCIFDNTAGFAALGDALSLMKRL